MAFVVLFLSMCSVFALVRKRLIGFMCVQFKREMRVVIYVVACDFLLCAWREQIERVCTCWLVCCCERDLLFDCVPKLIRNWSPSRCVCGAWNFICENYRFQFLWWVAMGPIVWLWASSVMLSIFRAKKLLFGDSENNIAQKPRAELHTIREFFRCWLCRVAKCKCGVFNEGGLWLFHDIYSPSACACWLNVWIDSMVKLLLLLSEVIHLSSDGGSRSKCIYSYWFRASRCRVFLI